MKLLKARFRSPTPSLTAPLILNNLMFAVKAQKMQFIRHLG